MPQVDRSDGSSQPWSIVVAGGSGNRYGGLKQFDPLAGRRVIDWSIDAMATPGRTVVVVPPDAVDELAQTFSDAVFVVVAGGSTRSASVRAGLAALEPSAEVVLVHDAARPLVTPPIVRAVVAALTGEGASQGAIPVTPVTDTIRDRDGTALDRSQLVAVQTPQGFSVSALRAAHAGEDEATDDATLVQRAGGVVVHVEGDPVNFKITVPSDLAQAEAVLADRSGVTTVPTFSTAIRIGQGFDVHPWSDDPARVLVLGGVAFPDAPGLAGHSDADAIAHAVTDAVLGACGAGDIGSLFPDTDPAHADADSIELLRRAVAVVGADGWVVVNADVTVILDAPRLAPHRQAMIENVSSALGGAPVSVKGKRTEGVEGLAGGVQAHAVALVERTTGQPTPSQLDQQESAR